MTPQKIILHKQSRTLELIYAAQPYILTAEFLRVHSPSAEVRGHGQPVLVRNKQQVGIRAIEAQGSYALRVVFDDGHDSGLYTWPYLHELALHRDEYWQRYCAQVEASENAVTPLHWVHPDAPR